MKNFRLLLGLLVGAGVLSVVATLLRGDAPEPDAAYAGPDGEITGGDVASFVD